MSVYSPNRVSRECAPRVSTAAAKENANTEGGRIALLLTASKQCDAVRAAAAARSQVCSQPPPWKGEVPRSSLYLTQKICTPYISTQAVPESTRILRIQTAALDAQRSPLDPATRFSEFARRAPPPVCQAIPQTALNANVPSSQGLRCQLGRRDLPILPG